MSRTYNKVKHQHLEHKPIKPNVIECQDCGKSHARVVKITRVQKPGPFWRKNCNCGLTENPLTGEYERLGFHEVNKQKKKKKCLLKKADTD